MNNDMDDKKRNKKTVVPENKIYKEADVSETKKKFTIAAPVYLACEQKTSKQSRNQEAGISKKSKTAKPDPPRLSLFQNSSDAQKHFGLPTLIVEKLPDRVSRKRKVLIYFVTAMSVVLVVGIVYKNIHPVKDQQPEHTTYEANVILVDADPIEPIITDTTKLYYIVTGSFENLYNARKMYSSLREKGNHPQILQKEDGVYRVILGTYETEKEINNELKSFLKKNSDMQVWVYKGAEEIQCISPL